MDDLQTMNIRMVIKDGRVVVRDGELVDPVTGATFDELSRPENGGGASLFGFEGERNFPIGDPPDYEPTPADSTSELERVVTLSWTVLEESAPTQNWVVFLDDQPRPTTLVHAGTETEVAALAAGPRALLFALFIVAYRCFFERMAGK